MKAGENNPLLDERFWESATFSDVTRALLAGADISDRHWKYFEEDGYREASGGYTPLHIAAEHSRKPEVVKMFLEHVLDHGVDIDVVDDFEQTPLHKAASNNTTEIVTLFLDKGANADAQDFLGNAPLHEVQTQEKAKLLLGHGVNIDIRDENGNTPLHKAVSRHWAPEVAMLLLKHGANVNACTKKRETDIFEVEGRCPLHIAAAAATPEMVKLLLDNGANIESYDGKGETPIHRAAEVGSVDVVSLLLDRTANVDIRTNDGRTPLHCVAGWIKTPGGVAMFLDNYGRRNKSSEALEAATLLLDHGADIESRDKKGRTPLHHALMPEMIMFLLERGANVNTHAGDGKTPLHEAASLGNKELVSQLLECGAAIEARANEGRTPLHEATRTNKNWEVIRTLLDRGADSTIRDEFGKTALDYVQENEHLNNYLQGNYTYQQIKKAHRPQWRFW